MALAAHDAQDRAEQLTLLTKRLAELIERETQLFRARRPLEAAPFRDEKAKLANIYRQETARIARELISDAKLANDGVTLRLPPSSLALEAGDIMRLEGSVYRIERVEDGLWRELELRRCLTDAAPIVVGGAGAAASDTSAPKISESCSASVDASAWRTLMTVSSSL